MLYYIILSMLRLHKNTCILLIHIVYYCVSFVIFERDHHEKNTLIVVVLGKENHIKGAAADTTMYMLFKEKCLYCTDIVVTVVI